MNLGLRILTFIFDVKIVKKPSNITLDRYRCSRCTDGLVDIDWKAPYPIPCYCNTCGKNYLLIDKGGT